MEVRSIYKYARISPFKVREVTREIQGLPVSAALDILAFTPKKAAILVNQTLKSAIANAENNANLKADRKSTRLNSSHQIISYAVFCLKKKTRGRAQMEEGGAASSSKR